MNPDPAGPAHVAFLLCGGAGTRLRGVTEQPKAVLPVAGWPFLKYHVESLAGIVERVVFLVGYGSEQVERTFGPATNDHVFVREYAPLGTGGALANAAPWAGDLNWVANGDSFVEVDPASVYAAHRAGPSPSDAATIVAVRLDDAADYGCLEIDADGRVTGFVEKGRGGTGWINAGVYVLPRSMLDELPATAVSSLERDVFPRWAGEGRLRAHQLAGAFFRDIGTPERLAAAQQEFARIRRRLEGAR